LLFRTRVTRHQGGQTSRAGGDDRDALAVLPDIPTVSEFVPGYESSFWTGVGTPKNTPAEIVDKLNKEINAALVDPKMKARLADLGGTPL
jgi:tripartite-type tricarboxylate transporter receptor subunit TctC